MEQILLAYGLPKETGTVIMILYENTKAMFRSSDGGINFFDIFAGVLQEDSYLFIIYQDYVLRMSVDLRRENGCILREARSRRYSEENVTDAENIDDLSLLSITPTQAKSQLK